MIDNKSDAHLKMDTESKLIFVQDIIKRYDNYIISTNAKASLIIAFNSLVLGTVILKFGDILSFYNCLGVRCVVGSLLILIAMSSLSSLFFVFSVVYPYFGSKTDDANQRNSLVYFGSVCKMNSQEYLNRFEICSDEELMEDLTKQATILAKGLNSKMLKMRHSITAITFSLAFILLLVILRAAQVLC